MTQQQDQTRAGAAGTAGARRAALALGAALALAGCATAPTKQAWETPPAPAAAPGKPSALPPEVESRLTILNSKCARGGTGSCIEIGRLYERGEGGFPHSAEKAAEAYGLACQRLEPEGCQRLEALLFADDTTPADLAPVQATFRAACAKRQADACAGLATLYAYGLGVPESAAKAVEILAAACVAGNGTACHRQAELTRLGAGTEASVEEAARLERQACVLGRQAACVAVAVRTLDVTEGRRRNSYWGDSSTDRALDAFRTACSKGEYSGCVEYARVQVDGRGITRNVQAGEDLLRSSCDDGYARACLVLGDQVRSGAGEKAGAAALGWWRRGCQLRAGDACARAGETLLRLERTAAEPPPPRADAEAGRALLERACTLHSPDGCRRLAQLAPPKAGAAEAARSADYAERACRWGAADGCPQVRAGRALRGL